MENISSSISPKLALRPKHEVHSTNFSGKQHPLHCEIFRPGDTNFHYHLSDDTKHAPVLLKKYYGI